MTPRFEWKDPAAKAFFDSHGFVIVNGVLSPAEVDLVQEGWNEVVEVASRACGMAAGAFAERFPQNRDLWSKSSTFRQLLFETGQAEVAQAFLGTSGVRLFHDHAIRKPAGRSGTIPWHQDSAYWPLDRAGVSLWTPVRDVSETGGCLHVLDGSHRDGPGEIQDFLATARVDRDLDPRRLPLPVRSGETVVLHGLTWHGSAPNVDGVDRIAYLTLWVPATSRFVPEHAAWHPTSAHIKVEAGDRLAGDWFPLFGEIAAEDEGMPVTFQRPRRSGGPTMFSASRDIAAQIAWLLRRPAASLAQLLSDEGRAQVLARVVALGLVDDAASRDLTEVMEDLVLQERVRNESTARDVYLVSVSRWWSIVGYAIQEIRGDD